MLDGALCIAGVVSSTTVSPCDIPTTQDNERMLTLCKQVAETQKALERCAASLRKVSSGIDNVTVLGRCVTSRLHASATAESVEELVVYLDKGMPSMNQ